MERPLIVALFSLSAAQPAVHAHATLLQTESAGKQPAGAGTETSDVVIR